MIPESRKSILAQSFILIGVMARLLPHPPNVTPVAAVALLGGAKLKGFWRWIVPIFLMGLSDNLLGWFYGIEPFSPVTPFIYGSFLINIILGILLPRRFSYKRMGALSVIGAIQFFLITNFGVWTTQTLYPMTFAGLLQCYTMALPFLGYSALGDLFWVFGLYLAMQKTEVWVVKLRPA